MMSVWMHGSMDACRYGCMMLVWMHDVGGMHDVGMDSWCRVDACLCGCMMSVWMHDVSVDA